MPSADRPPPLPSHPSLHLRLQQPEVHRDQTLLTHPHKINQPHVLPTFTNPTAAFPNKFWEVFKNIPKEIRKDSLAKKVCGKLSGKLLEMILYERALGAFNTLLRATVLPKDIQQSALMSWFGFHQTL